MRRFLKAFAGATAVIALSACMVAPAFAADASGRGGLEGAAEALRNELAPSMLTFDKWQEQLGAESSVSIERARVQGLQDVMYNGQPENPTVTLKLDNTTLRAGEDFDVEFSGDNVNPGTVSVLITGKGAYSGTIETSFTILPGDLSYATVDVIPDQTWTGEEICPLPAVKLNDQELVAGTDYTVEYRNNVDEGTATIVIEGTGNCTGKTRVTFEIVESGEEGGSSQTSSPSLAVIITPIAAALVAIAIVVAFVLRGKRTTASNAKRER